MCFVVDRLLSTLYFGQWLMSQNQSRSESKMPPHKAKKFAVLGRSLFRWPATRWPATPKVFLSIVNTAVSLSIGLALGFYLRGPNGPANVPITPTTDSMATTELAPAEHLNEVTEEKGGEFSFSFYRILEGKSPIYSPEPDGSEVGENGVEDMGVTDDAALFEDHIIDQFIPDQYYIVQAGSFSKEQDAVQRTDELLTLGFDTAHTEIYVDEQDRILYRVIVGPFLDENDAVSVQSRLLASKIDNFIVVVTGGKRVAEP